MNYRIEFEVQLKETINGSRLFSKVKYEMLGVKPDQLAKAIEEIGAKGYTITRVVVPGISDD